MHVSYVDIFKRDCSAVAQLGRVFTGACVSDLGHGTDCIRGRSTCARHDDIVDADASSKPATRAKIKRPGLNIERIQIGQSIQDILPACGVVLDYRNGVCVIIDLQGPDIAAVIFVDGLNKQIPAEPIKVHIPVFCVGTVVIHQVETLDRNLAAIVGGQVEISVIVFRVVDLNLI